MLLVDDDGGDIDSFSVKESIASIVSLIVNVKQAAPVVSKSMFHQPLN